MSFDHEMQITFRANPGVSVDQVADAIVALGAGAWTREDVLHNRLPGDDEVKVIWSDGAAVAFLRTIGEAPESYLQELQAWVKNHIEPIAEPGRFTLRNYDAGDHVVQVEFGAPSTPENPTLRERVQSLPEGDVMFYTQLLDVNADGADDCYGRFEMNKEKLLDILDIARQLKGTSVLEATIPWHCTTSSRVSTDLERLEIMGFDRPLEDVSVSYRCAIGESSDLLVSTSLTLGDLVSAIEDALALGRKDVFVEEHPLELAEHEERERLEWLRGLFASKRQPAPRRFI